MTRIECYNTQVLLETIKNMGFAIDKRELLTHCKLNKLVVCIYNTGTVCFQGTGGDCFQKLLEEKIDEINNEIKNKFKNI